jgi:predicted negative regulator of RcsB-dependent stress response
MIRSVLLIAAIGGAALLAGGPARAQEKVTFYDHAQKKEDSVTGAIEAETAAGIKIKVRGAVKEVPALDVRSVIYKSDKFGVTDFRQDGKEERAAMPATKPDDRKRLLREALEGYRAMAPKLGDNPNARRYVEFKAAHVLAQLAREDPTQVEAAVAALTKYKAAYPGGWEIVPALKLLAQMQEEKGDLTAAVQTYGELINLPEAPREMKRESEILVAKMLVRGGKYADAEARLKALSTSLAADDPQKPFIQVYLAQSQIAQNNLGQAEAQLKAVLAGTADADVKALAHNFLGDYYQAKNQPEEAFWHYLRVDVLYSQEKNEHAKALYHLWKLFDKVKNDRERAQACLDRLMDKQYADSEYQKRAAKEKAP